MRSSFFTTGGSLGLAAAALLVPLALDGHEAHQIQHPHGGEGISLRRPFVVAGRHFSASRTKLGNESGKIDRHIIRVSSTV